jgi:hypothetical protein
MELDLTSWREAATARKAAIAIVEDCTVQLFRVGAALRDLGILHTALVEAATEGEQAAALANFQSRLFSMSQFMPAAMASLASATSMAEGQSQLIEALLDGYTPDGGNE